MLGTDQQTALNLIKNFINTDSTAFSLIGSAGTGKTFLMNYLIKDLSNLNIVLCAPTHKAKLVLERSTGRECITLHSLLSLSPNLDIFDLDFRDLLFKTSKETLSIPRRGLVICDEASMINDDLFKLLTQKCQERKTKILFVSDRKQLIPVKSEYESLVYTVENQFELKEIFRQAWDNTLTPILVNLRNHCVDTFEESSKNLHVVSNTKEFVELYLNKCKKLNSDILECKLLAYRNKRVDKYNEVIKKLLFNNDLEYNKLEIITSNENFEFGSSQFWNSMDYIICSEPYKTDKYLPHFGYLPGYILELYDFIYNESNKVFILSKDISKDFIDSLAYKIEDIRIDALQAVGRKRGMLWKFYYELFNSFTTPFELEVDSRLIKKKTFMSGYACTVHKSQGSTFNNIFVDLKDINSCYDDTIRRQLQYVALSRTKNDAYILQ